MNFDEYWFNTDETMLFPNECEIAARAAWDKCAEEAAKVAEDMGRTKGYACGIAVSNEIRQLKTKE